MSKFFKYFLTGIIFWVIIDYATAFNPNFQDWINHMPLVWLFYIGYPLLFAFLIYKKEWSSKKIFFMMLIATFGLEGVIFRNPLQSKPPKELKEIFLWRDFFQTFSIPPKALKSASPR